MLKAQSATQVATQAFVVTRMIDKFHVEPRLLDDRFSHDLLHLLLEMADGGRICFLKEDLVKLQAYDALLDDEIRLKRTAFLNLFTSLYTLRLKQADSLIEATCVKMSIVTTGGNGFAEDTLVPVNLAAVKNKIIKYTTQAGACSALQHEVNRILLNPAGSAAAIGNLYCKAIALCYDPHTEFFPLTEKENFDSELGQQPFRFGFRIKGEKDGIYIENLQPGSPAYRSGQLQKGDKIIEVQWAGKLPVRIAQNSMEQLNALLAMSNHDTLLISVKKVDGVVTRVPLIKEQQSDDSEENRVKSFLLKGSQTAGYIYLPSFYEDWEAGSIGLKGCANDVAKEIVKLKKENINGLILDLRFNGGGSVQEATELAGIFIDAGPVAQLKTKEPKPFVLNDVNRGAVYDGPLVVLVNGYSASASELLAGVLQDYNRAIIVGSVTYGKATGQVMFPLDTTVTPENARERQSSNYIKITSSKLYRVNGTTIQATGVIPSVLVNDSLQLFAEREADAPFALKATSVAANKYYKPYPLLPIITTQTITAEFKQPPVYSITNHQFEMSLLKPGSYMDQLNEAFKKTLSKDAGVQTAYEVLLKLNKK
jgi:carboxyl-terminal processing protease